MCDEYLKTSRRTITVFSRSVSIAEGFVFRTFSSSSSADFTIQILYLYSIVQLLVSCYFFSVLIIRSCLSNSGRLLLIQSLFCLSFLITSRSILTAAPSKNTQYPPTDYKFYNWSNLHITDQQLGQSNLTSLRLSRTMYTQQNF